MPEGEVGAVGKLAASLADKVEAGDRMEFLGDMLFELACLVDKLGIDAESALRQANLRFERRLSHTQGMLADAPAETN
jgi:hypothetical protein